ILPRGQRLARPATGVARHKAERRKAARAEARNKSAKTAKHAKTAKGAKQARATKQAKAGRHRGKARG
ncbi:MAG: hypothetical protein IKT16_08125, partial [Desulfovibrio sp.]|nr:hypothetical protein [Desulfovibrio sp.]